jgi:hypothetical protein
MGRAICGRAPWSLNLAGVTFHPGIAAADAAAGRGAVDYRLQRMRLIADVEAGMADRSEVCDVHPELLRVARNVAQPTGEDCPICDKTELRTICYVFGPRLGGGGKCVTSLEDRQRLARRSGDFSCYDVEVCAGCGWNHLLRRYPLTS